MVFAVRDLTQYEEFLQVREVQQQIWGFTQGEGLYPPMLKTAAENGGTIIGAFDGAKLIGFLFGFLGLHTDRRLKLCSQTMGILPEYRNKGVAATLKWAQRERVLANDIDLITWTYDPLEAPNARLNLRTLGGVAHVYKQNIYGENFGALGKGLPSDRFLVEWWIKSDRVQQRHDRAAGGTDRRGQPDRECLHRRHRRSAHHRDRSQPRRADRARGNSERPAGDQENQHGAGAGLAPEDARPV